MPTASRQDEQSMPHASAVLQGMQVFEGPHTSPTAAQSLSLLQPHCPVPRQARLELRTRQLSAGLVLQLQTPAVQAGVLPVQSGFASQVPDWQLSVVQGSLSVQALPSVRSR